jgi:hypothetical protein
MPLAVKLGGSSQNHIINLYTEPLQTHFARHLKHAKSLLKCINICVVCRCAMEDMQQLLEHQKLCERI